MRLRIPLVTVAFGALIAAFAAPSCGGDACLTLADQFAECPGGSTTASTGSSDDDDQGPVCTDKEKIQAQCVLDLKLDQALLCKIKNKTATVEEQGPYDTCYAM